MSQPDIAIPFAVAQEIDAALKETIKTAVALSDNTPYPDDPRWSPWTRWWRPVCKRCERAREALQEAMANAT